ncbi:MAG: PfkB family carbohydrate kinase [Spirochaetia bacterium]|jgi:sugar/nucleoside kinase (ribokinase family)|nr:PfkB family carbohydrate kinase [Spirochaetia bacterium]
MDQVLCIGNTSYDITAYFEKYPEENSKYMTQDFNECSGGPAANASALLAEWGLDAAFIGVTGDDIYGELIEKELSQKGVDCSGMIKRIGTKTPLSIIIVNLENGSRTLINRNKLEQTGIQASQGLKKYNPSVLLFDGYELETALESIKMFPGAKTILDAGSLRKETEILASRVDYLVCSERFASSVSGIENIKENSGYTRAFKALKGLNKNNIVITMGEEGMVFEKEGEDSGVTRLDAFKVKAVDTTGAGDIYHGAFAWCLTQGYSLEKTIVFSAAASALSVQKRGGITSIPSLAEVREFLGKQDQGNW